MTKDEALKLALDAKIHKAGMNPIMQGPCYLMHPNALQAVIDVALREALANEALDKMAENARELGLDYEPAQQEPVAVADGTFNHNCPLGTPLYTTPPQRTWVGLSDKDITETFDEVPSAQNDPWWLRYAKAIEAKLRSKNT